MSIKGMSGEEEQNIKTMRGIWKEEKEKRWSFPNYCPETQSLIHSYINEYNGIPKQTVSLK